MKIVLHAFGNKLKGVMEVPEDTNHRFRLVMTQPIQVFNDGQSEHALMSVPLTKCAVFEWTGKIYTESGHEYDGARIYQLTNFE